MKSKQILVGLGVAGLTVLAGVGHNAWEKAYATTEI